MDINQSFGKESAHLLDAALVKIEHCLGQLTEEQVWWRSAEDQNSIGNLLLHISGNLRQWAIVPLTGAEDLRQRGEEFASKGKPKLELLSLVCETVEEAKTQFGGLGQVDLLAQQTIQGFDVSLMGAIIHTTTHFVGHTHQIILLTRLQLGEGYSFEWSTDNGRDFLPI